MTVELFGGADPRLREAMAVRFAVFVDEQGVPPEMERDEHDDVADARVVHALVRAESIPIAAGRLYERDRETAQIGRMAVLLTARGLGAGRAMLDALLVEGRRRGYARARLSAQTHAMPFYERAGFVAIGETYDDAGIPHRDMERAL